MDIQSSEGETKASGQTPTNVDITKPSNQEGTDGEDSKREGGTEDRKENNSGGANKAPSTGGAGGGKKSKKKKKKGDME